MTLKIDVLGFEYEDSVPAFTELTSGYYYHRISKKMYGKPSFDAWLTAEGKAFGTGELGDQPASYKADHFSIVTRGTPVTAGPPPGPAPAPLTVSVTKVPTTTANDTGSVTIAGGPADKAYTITLTLEGQNSGGADVQNVAIAKGDTAAVAAGKVVAAESDPDVSSSNIGGVIIFTPKTGDNIKTLSVSIV